MQGKQTMTNRMVARSAGVISFWTLASRILGLVRDMATASIFGAGMVWDAFVIAFMIPNFMRDLFAEGGLSSAFIPVFTEYLHTKTRQEALRLANVVRSVLVMVVTGLVLLGMLGIIFVLGRVGLIGKLELVLRLSMFLLPYLLFVSVAAWAMGILNSFKHFFLPALAPVMLNICWIASLFLLVPCFGDTPQEKIFGLAVGVLLGGLLQLVIQIPGLLAKDFRFEFKLLFSHPGLRQVGRLMAPAVFGLAITQLNLAVDLILGYFLGDGAISALWYGNRLMQLPLGVFGIAVATAVLPTMSEQAALNHLDGLKQTLIFALKMVFLITLPAAAGLIVLRIPIIQLLFQRGQFGIESTQRTAWTLLFYCLGLFAYAGVHVVVRAYYSLKDTITPVRIGAVALISNIFLNLVLMQFLREGGLALATAISSMLNLTLLSFVLRRKICPWQLKGILVLFLKVMLSSAIMAVVGYLLSTRVHVPVLLRSNFLILQVVGNLLLTRFHVLIVIPISMVVFFICCRIFRIEEAGTLLKWILKRK